MEGFSAHEAPGWAALAEGLILLSAALGLGAVTSRLRLGPTVGYILAGALLGPHGLHLLGDVSGLDSVTELGVTLLLFAIGLEFPWRVLRSMGRGPLLGGGGQIVLTGLVGFGISLALGASTGAALAIGAVLALSSTASVLRTLSGRTETDTVHGRLTVSVLILQDLALVPLLLLVTAMGQAGSPAAFALALGSSVGLTLVLVAVLMTLARVVMPRVLAVTSSLAHRELAILLALVTAIGAAYFAHRLGLSPALGSFLAGMLLADSPFAMQLRSDVEALKAIFLALFFVSIGFLFNGAWVVQHPVPVALATAGVLVFKALAASVSLIIFGAPRRAAFAAGICLAQIGEFSYVLALQAAILGLFSPAVMALIVAALVLTLIATPLLIALGARISLRAAGVVSGETRQGASIANRLVVVGFGPAGAAAATEAQRSGRETVVIELNPRLIAQARKEGFEVHLGDATHPEVLRHAGVGEAAAVAVTVPDHHAAARIIQLVRFLAPGVLVVARSRFHLHTASLFAAGADHVVDEEQEVGEMLTRLLCQEVHGDTWVEGGEMAATKRPGLGSV
ncbi:MAG: sodium:proton exchanger [Acidobacteria bacterium]|nr:MAG: sodium:proton exchanger [Acidobacteriota bacterium]